MKKFFFLTIILLSGLSLAAQTEKPVTDTTQKTLFICPMHPEITGTAKDKCSKCGMSLVEAKKYVCPMHPEVTAMKKGKCSKCGMDLVEQKPAKNKKG